MNISDAVWPLLGSALSLVLAIGGAILIPMVRKWLAAKVGIEKSTLLLDWAFTAVQAAEQLLGPKQGDAKYAFVLKALSGVAESHNIKVDAITLQAAIESAVHELRQSTKPPAPSAVGNVVVTTPGAPVIETKEGQA